MGLLFWVTQQAYARFAHYRQLAFSEPECLETSIALLATIENYFQLPICQRYGWDLCQAASTLLVK
jgi:hypothetical protein